jgi:hypothetical protein
MMVESAKAGILLEPSKGCCQNCIHPLVFVYQRITMHFLLRTLAILTFCWTFASTAFVDAGDVNRILNPGFENGLIEPWIVNSNFNAVVSSDDSVERTRSLLVDHEGVESNTEVVLNYKVGQPCCVQPGAEYIFSVNGKIDSGDGRIVLFARFDGNPDRVQNKSWWIDGVRDWQKYEMKVQVPEDASTMMIGCQFVETTGRNSMDWAQLYDISSLVRNGDFENDGYWSLNHGMVTENQPYFGDRSMEIRGFLNKHRWAAQFVDLASTIEMPDQPMYTIAVHLKTLVYATSAYEPPVYDCNSDDIDEDLDPVHGSGAQIQISCYQSGRELRRLYMPFFEGRSTEFTERKVSFLVPEGTDGLVIALVVVDADMVAFFDNVRLTCDNAASSSGPVSRQFGRDASVVEAPEPETYVTVDGPTDVEFDEAICRVSDFDNKDYGKLVWVPRGEYLVRRIIPKSRLQLKMHRDARIRRDPTGTDGFRGTLIRNDLLFQFNQVSDVIIEGGHYLRAFESEPPDNNNLGNIIAIYGDRIVLRNFYIPAWSQTTKWIYVDDILVEVPNSDIAVSFLGHDIYAYNNTIVGPAGNYGDGTGPGAAGFDGIHYFGGERAHFMGNHVYSGDDCVGLFTGTIPYFLADCENERRRLFIFNRNIRDVEVDNCRLSCNWGRAVSCGLARPRSDEADLTAVVENIRARNIVGRQGGEPESLSVICVPRPPMAIYPGQECPTAEMAADDPLLFPDRPPQVRNVHFSDMQLTVDVSLQAAELPVQQAIKIYTEDVGSVENILIDNITIWTVCQGPCEWSDDDRPKNLLQVRRAGLLCEHFVIDPETGQYVSDGFSQVGISHRNYQIKVANCRFFDNTGSFLHSYNVQSTEPQSKAMDDVNDVATDNFFQNGLEGIWQVLPDGIHDPG